MEHNPIWDLIQQTALRPELKDLTSLWQNKQRHPQFSVESGELYLDLSKNWIDEQALDLLCELANQASLSEAINRLFNGGVVNPNEKQSASHTRLRDPENHQQHVPMFELASAIHQSHIKTAFGKPVKQLVNIGIGGSYLGPRLVVEALTELQSESITPVYFAASVDDSLINQLFQSVDIEHCLFCISSKSFTTAETLMNANAIQNKLKSISGYQPGELGSSLMAITANQEKAVAAGIPEDMILTFDASVGGRFSLWSAIGFPIVVAAGEQAFLDLLKGANDMDRHYRDTPYHRNMPVLMALMSIWYRNALKLPAYACLPYDARLRCLPQWLQQLMMESTGKMHDLQGQAITYPTSPFVFGDHGQLSQHAFFQAFHQGVDALALDFIGVLEKDSRSQDFLLFNLIAQSAALMQGKKDNGNMNACPGNKPSTTLLMRGMNARAMGQLLAMYEHMIYTQAVIWNINCFDQPGVELGKQLARDIQQHVSDDSLDQMALDPSTLALIKRVKQP